MTKREVLEKTGADTAEAKETDRCLQVWHSAMAMLYALIRREGEEWLFFFRSSTALLTQLRPLQGQESAASPLAGSRRQSFRLLLLQCGGVSLHHANAARQTGRRV